MKTEIEVDGAAYDLLPAISRDSIGVSLVISIRRKEDRVAELCFRCAADEPAYPAVETLQVEEMLELILRRGDMAGRVLSALHWQSELDKIQPGAVSPLIVAMFPENHAHGCL